MLTLCYAIFTVTPFAQKQKLAPVLKAHTLTVAANNKMTEETLNIINKLMDH